MALDPNQIADDAVGHMLDLLRYSESVREGLLARLDRLVASLRHLTADSGLRAGGYTSQTYRRQEALIRKAAREIQTAYGEMADALDAGLAALAPGEAEWAAQALTRAADGAIRAAGLSGREIDVALAGANVGGATPAEWLAKLALDLRTRFAQAVRNASMQRQGAEQILNELERAGGLRGYAQNAVGGLLRSAVPAAANAIQYATYENHDVEGIQWFATLDPKTCLSCARLDGAAWSLAGEPLSSSATGTAFPGPPPSHWGCRCVIGPVVSASALASTLTYQDWLTSKSPAFVQSYLGPGRAKLWAAGKLTLADLVSPTGRKLTLDQLYRKVRN